MLLSTLSLATAIAAPPPPPAPAAPRPPRAADALIERLAEVAEAGQPGDVTIRENFSFSINDGTNRIVLNARDGEVTASVNGEAVPADRIRREGRSWVILGADGEVLHRLPVQIANLGFGEAIGRGGGVGGGVRGLPGVAPAPPRRVIVEGLPLPGGPADPPATMIGVHMGQPGDVVTAQLGLDPAASTVITGVLGGLPAEVGGIEPFDIVIAINGTVPADPAALRQAAGDAKPGEQLTLTVIRRGTPRDVTLTLEAWDMQRMNTAPLDGRVAADPMVEAIAPDRVIVEGLPLPGGGMGMLRLPRGMGGMGGGGEGMDLDMELFGDLRLEGERIQREVEEALRRHLPGMLEDFHRDAEIFGPRIREELMDAFPMLRERMRMFEPGDDHGGMHEGDHGEHGGMHEGDHGDHGEHEDHWNHGEADRMERIEDRIDRIERMLERLMDRLESRDPRRP